MSSIDAITPPQWLPTDRPVVSIVGTDLAAAATFELRTAGTATSTAAELSGPVRWANASRVVFTVNADLAGLGGYDLRLLDAAGAEIANKPAAVTVVATLPPATLELAWDADKGRVRALVLNLRNPVVLRRVDGTDLRPVRGFADPLTATGVAYDYEMPLGVTVAYVLADPAAARYTTEPTFTVRTGAGGVAWLRDPSLPLVATTVDVVALTEEENARQTVYRIAGKRGPVVVHDVRDAKTGELVLLVRTAAARHTLQRILATGNPLLLNICADLAWSAALDVRPGSGGVYITCGTLTWNRIGAAAAWQLAMDYTEVDWPEVGITIPPDATYRQLQTLGYTYRDLLLTYRDYLHVLINSDTATTYATGTPPAPDPDPDPDPYTVKPGQLDDPDEQSGQQVAS